MPLGTAVVSALLVATVLTGCGAEPATTCHDDAVTARSLGELKVFTGWLDSHHAQGVVGEVGWPGGDRWNALASRWYGAAESAGLGSFAWAGAEQWPPDYALAVYRSHASGGALDVAGPQAHVIERHPGRGLALADGSFGASTDDSSYSSQDPGSYGADYRYPSPESLTYLHDRGVSTVRVAFAWERIQPRPGAPLSEPEVGRLRAVLASADAAQLRVVLDLHSYGRYAGVGPDGRRQVALLGSADLPASDLADLWRRLATALADAPARGGYGLMNEPHDLPGGPQAWERASQLAVDAVREVDRTTPLLVAGYGYSSVNSWPKNHPRPWIRGGPVLYEAHQYFDGDHSGAYDHSYADELARAQKQGWVGC